MSFYEMTRGFVLLVVGVVGRAIVLRERCWRSNAPPGRFGSGILALASSRPAIPTMRLCLLEESICPVTLFHLARLASPMRFSSGIRVFALSCWRI